MSETSRQLYVHRNTLVYRLEKLEKSTGLDIRKFDDALTFKIANDGRKLHDVYEQQRKSVKPFRAVQDCGSAKHGAIRGIEGVKRLFDPDILSTTRGEERT